MLKRLHFAGPQTSCKICKGPAPLYGVADFNKNCLEREKVFLPLLGEPVYYHQCESCRLIFSTAFDDWSAADFKAHIYNDDYVTVDPEYVEIRPRKLAGMVFNFIKRGTNLKLLDYGGCEGKTAALLREKGIAATSWDPMAAAALPRESAFDVVTCFEVFEHTPQPVVTAEDALRFLKPQGVLLFSTLTAEGMPPRHMDFWYIAPRNGHITIYSKAALKVLFESLGCTVHHFNDNVHMAYRQLPAWLAT